MIKLKNNKILISENRRLCNSCCTVDFADDCCCFLDPTPYLWSSALVYNKGDMVRMTCPSLGYEVNYFSTQDNNYNNSPCEPGTTKWQVYFACGNESWDSAPPFGGAYKTPLYYNLSFRVDTTYEIYGCNSGVVELQFKMSTDADAYFIATKDPGTCNWYSLSPESLTVHTKYDITGDNCGLSQDETDLTATASIGMNASVTQFIGGFDSNFVWRSGCALPEGNCMSIPWYSTATRNAYCGGADYTTNGCTLSGRGYQDVITVTETATCGVTDYDRRIVRKKFWCSWNPRGETTTYVKYSTTENYSINRRVYYGGFFWRCCIANGPDSVNGVQSPLGESETCTGTNYWRLDF